MTPLKVPLHFAHLTLYQRGHPEGCPIVSSQGNVKLTNANTSTRLSINHQQSSKNEIEAEHLLQIIYEKMFQLLVLPSLKKSVCFRFFGNSN